jgi:hypothetical protein
MTISLTDPVTALQKVKNAFLVVNLLCFTAIGLLSYLGSALHQTQAISVTHEFVESQIISPNNRIRVYERLNNLGVSGSVYNALGGIAAIGGFVNLGIVVYASWSNRRSQCLKS